MPGLWYPPGVCWRRRTGGFQRYLQMAVAGSRPSPSWFYQKMVTEWGDIRRMARRRALGRESSCVRSGPRPPRGRTVTAEEGTGSRPQWCWNGALWQGQQRTTVPGVGGAPLSCRYGEDLRGGGRAHVTAVHVLLPGQERSPW